MDCLLNYGTVRYFGGEEYEAQRYTEAIGEYQSLERSRSQNLVDTEELLHLLNEPTEVVDEPDAKELVVTNGEVEFGGRVALAGESGAGRSTILRLYRFYDLQPTFGRILIDGQDIRTVTLSSLRRVIGVVPQDSVLFNATI
ncbi:hypothetical protein EDB19DRAFT_1772473, partial [Suillus lakei]